MAPNNCTNWLLNTNSNRKQRISKVLPCWSSFWIFSLKFSWRIESIVAIEFDSNFSLHNGQLNVTSRVYFCPVDRIATFGQSTWIIITSPSAICLPSCSSALSWWHCFLSCWPLVWPTALHQLNSNLRTPLHQLKISKLWHSVLFACITQSWCGCRNSADMVVTVARQNKLAKSTRRIKSSIRHWHRRSQSSRWLQINQNLATQTKPWEARWLPSSWTSCQRSQRAPVRSKPLVRKWRWRRRAARWPVSRSSANQWMSTKQKRLNRETPPYLTLAHRPNASLARSSDLCSKRASKWILFLLNKKKSSF